VAVDANGISEIFSKELQQLKSELTNLKSPNTYQEKDALSPSKK